jgi:TPR repeat protein
VAVFETRQMAPEVMPKIKGRIQVILLPKTIFHLAFLILMTALISPALAEARDDKTRCAQMGALAADPQRPAPAVAFEEIDAKSLIVTCQAALREPTTKTEKGQYYLHLGRGFLRNRQPERALESFEMSVQHDYPAGYFALGVAYLLGDDVAANPAAARQYLEKALALQVHWAAKALSTLYSDRTLGLYDLQLAKHYQAIFNDYQPD